MGLASRVPTIVGMSPIRCRVLAVAFGAVVAVGCGQSSTIDASKLEAEIKKDLTADAGVAPKGIACPGDIESENGTKFECTGTAPNGDTFTIDVELTNDSGGFKAVVPRDQFKNGSSAAVAAVSKLRKPSPAERRALTRKYRSRHRKVLHRTALNGICVVRAHSRYAAIYVNWKSMGVEGTVFKRSGGRWRYVTGGSDWTGTRPVRALLKGFSARCGHRAH
jgi:hypothetical protein